MTGIYLGLLNLECYKNISQKAVQSCSWIVTQAHERLPITKDSTSSSRHASKEVTICGILTRWIGCLDHSLRARPEVWIAAAWLPH